MNQTPSKARYIVTAFAVPRHHHLHRPRGDLGRAALIPADSADAIADGLGAGRLRLGLRDLRDPRGWLGDRIGPRRVLMRIVLWWSFFTAATGWVLSPTSLIVIRALFGAGEAGAFPNLTRVLTTWLPKKRTRARPGAALAGHALQRRLHAAARRVADLGADLAAHVRGLRRCIGVDLGGPLLPLVPRRPGRAPGRQQGRTRDAAAGQRDGRRATPACPGGVIFSNPHVWLLSHPVHVPRRTAGGSTSTGCRRICANARGTSA